MNELKKTVHTQNGIEGKGNFGLRPNVNKNPKDKNAEKLEAIANIKPIKPSDSTNVCDGNSAKKREG